MLLLSILKNENTEFKNTEKKMVYVQISISDDIDDDIPFENADKKLAF